MRQLPISNPQFPTPNPAPTVPPLENGDRLTRYEFERRYATMPTVKKAELIEGMVYMPAALRFRSHGEPHSHLMTWLGVYQTFTPKVALGDNPTVRLDLDNEVQPDGVLLIATEAGGQTRISDDDYVEGAPELIVEVAASSVSIDLHLKKQVYRRCGVQEYLVWQVLDQKISWFGLEQGEYLERSPDESGILRSQVYPGLWLAVPSLLAGDMRTVLSTLQSGLGSPEHQEFALKLTQA